MSAANQLSVAMQHYDFAARKFYLVGLDFHFFMSGSCLRVEIPGRSGAATVHRPGHLPGNKEQLSQNAADQESHFQFKSLEALRQRCCGCLTGMSANEHTTLTVTCWLAKAIWRPHNTVGNRENGDENRKHPLEMLKFIGLTYYDSNMADTQKSISNNIGPGRWGALSGRLWSSR